MDLTTCSACVVAGSAGGAVLGFGVGRRRRGRRCARRSRSGRTMRVWPGRRPERDDGGGAS
ncbi:hypothetical protein ACFFTK_03900 [Pseudonocardia petroleophila]|uniref:Uncharacterized protein n=1 Tax=Pseudonocardia petroleophila TaxID=37331 RepID=A0A7G7MQ49_9PSEU|nr:hypothetical protein [Pseudonocardia petroleophila]QNG54910.1 hypothetical protein H6H00_14145 [Pseudonocardia petroleophila]